MFKLGCLKDKVDNRDHLMRAYLPIKIIPKKLDLTNKMSPVRDQGNEGTCVGFASTVGMKEYQELADYEKLISLSPRFLYSECKKIDGMPEAEGTTIRAAMKALKNIGVCRESFWPYIPNQSDKPQKGSISDAKKFRVLRYARIIDLNELRITLATKGACVIGVQVFEAMMKTKTGIIPMPKRNETSIGGHAICPVGYDDNKKLIKFKNSWSNTWGNKGYGYLPYKYIETYMMDAWSSVDIIDPNPLTIASVIKFSNRNRF